MEKAVTPLHLTHDQGAPPPKIDQTQIKMRPIAHRGGRQSLGIRPRGLLMPGRNTCCRSFECDIVDLLDPWVVAGGEEMLVFNVDIVDFLDPRVAAGGEETLFFNVNIVDLLDPGKAAGGEKKAARLGRSTRQAGW